MIVYEYSGGYFMKKIDESKYPMTEEEFIKRVKELYLEHSTWPMDIKLEYINSKMGLEDMKHEYINECYDYDRYVNDYPEYPNLAFTDEGMIGTAVSTLDLITE